MPLKKKIPNLSPEAREAAEQIIMEGYSVHAVYSKLDGWSISRINRRTSDPRVYVDMITKKKPKKKKKKKKLIRYIQ